MIGAVIALVASGDQRQTASSDENSWGGKVANPRPFAFKDTPMYAPFDHRIRLRVGLSFRIVLLLVGFVATPGLAHTP